jgi:hypothetical protein
MGFKSIMAIRQISTWLYVFNTTTFTALTSPALA